MADKSKIEWCDATWNPAVGCEKVSDGCARCYAERMAMRFRRPGMPFEGVVDRFGWTGLTRFFPERLEQPFHWRKPRKIFVCSMCDLFHESITNEQIAAVFGVMAATHQHQYVVLTKRLQRALEWFEWVDTREIDGRGLFPYDDNGWRIRQMLNHCVSKNGINPPPHHGGPWPIENVIMCASVENQPTVNERVSLLLQIPARWRGVSVEPMLGPVDFFESGAFESDSIGGRESHTIRSFFRSELDFVICGAETGPGKRPFNDDWALDLRDQCKAAGTPYFFKKDGAGKPTLCGVEYHEWVK